MSTESASFLYLSKGRILLVGNALDNGDHSHHALQITLTLEDRPFIIRHIGGEDSTACSLIKPNYMHQIDVTDTWRLLILIDAETEAAKQIEERYLQENSIATPSLDDIDYCRQRMQHFAHEAQSVTETEAAINDVVARFAGSIPEPTEKDPRVTKVIQAIHQARGGEVNAEQLAEVACLSRDRLSHLFKQEVGIPIKSYILWYKLCQTGFKVVRGMTVSDAAAEAGFADAAHYSRTFRKMFGMTPSQILRRSNSVQVVSDIQF